MKPYKNKFTLGIFMAMVGIGLLGAERVNGQQVQLQAVEKKPTVQAIKKVEEPKITVEKQPAPTVQMKAPAQKAVSIKNVSKQKKASSKKSISKHKKVTHTTDLEKVTSTKHIQKVETKKLPANVNLKVQPQAKPRTYHPQYKTNIGTRPLPNLSTRGTNQSNMQTHSLNINRPHGDGGPGRGNSQRPPSKGKKPHGKDGDQDALADGTVASEEGPSEAEIVDINLYRNPRYRKLMIATLSFPFTQSFGEQIWRSPFWVTKLNEFLLLPLPALAVNKTPQEYWYWQVKNDPQWFEDMDGDGLTALAERIFKTDPHNPDSNGNGQTDLEDALAGVDPQTTVTEPVMTSGQPHFDRTSTGAPWPVQLIGDSLVSEPTSSPEATSTTGPGPSPTDSGSDENPEGHDEPLHPSGAGEGR